METEPHDFLIFPGDSSLYTLRCMRCCQPVTLYDSIGQTLLHAPTAMLYHWNMIQFHDKQNHRESMNKILPPCRIPLVGIVQKVPSTTNTTIHKHHHHGGAVFPSYDVGSMDPPNLMVVTSLEGVGQERFAWV
jgi:hypothetical protein